MNRIPYNVKLWLADLIHTVYLDYLISQTKTRLYIQEQISYEASIGKMQKKSASFSTGLRWSKLYLDG